MKDIISSRPAYISGSGSQFGPDPYLTEQAHEDNLRHLQCCTDQALRRAHALLATDPEAALATAIARLTLIRSRYEDRDLRIYRTYSHD